MWTCHVGSNSIQVQTLFFPCIRDSEIRSRVLTPSGMSLAFWVRFIFVFDAASNASLKEQKFAAAAARGGTVDNKIRPSKVFELLCTVSPWVCLLASRSRLAGQLAP